MMVDVPLQNPEFLKFLSERELLWVKKIDDTNVLGRVNL